MMQSKMKELDLKETSSKSLLANVLDMDDDYRPNNRKNIQISTVNRTFYRYAKSNKFRINFFFEHLKSLDKKFKTIYK